MTLLEKVKANLILEHSADDELLQMYIAVSVKYAESYQHLTEDYYTENQMPPTMSPKATSSESFNALKISLRLRTKRVMNASPAATP